MEEDKIKRLIEAVADLSGITPDTASLVAIRGEKKGTVIALGNPDEIVKMLRQGMEEKPDLKYILSRAVNGDDESVSSYLMNKISELLGKVGSTAKPAVFAVADNNAGVTVLLKGNAAKIIKALKTAMTESPEVKQIIEFALKCNGDCSNCNMDHGGITNINLN